MLRKWLQRVKTTLRVHVGSHVEWKSIASVLAIAAGFLILTLLLHLPHGSEHWSADLATAYLSKRPQTQYDKIRLVYVTDQTLERYPYTSPTDRQLLADLIGAIDRTQPLVIGIDFIFDRPTEKAKDDALLKTLKEAHSPIVLGASYEARPSQTPDFQNQFLAAAHRDVGHLHFDEHHSILVISDHVVRFMAEPPPGAPYQKSFAELLAEKAGSHFHPNSEYISWLLNPRNGAETFFSLSADQVLGRSGPPLELKGLFGGKIVLIGGNFFDRDQHLTPLSVISDERFPGLSIHAQILAQLLDKRTLNLVSWPMQFLVMIAAAALGFWMGRSQRNWLLFELVSVAGLVAAAIIAFGWFSLILPYNGMLLCWLCGAAAGHYGKPAHG